MKYLIQYKIFESSKLDNFNDILQIIKHDFNVVIRTIEESMLNNNKNIISRGIKRLATIYKPNNIKFNIVEIKDELTHLFELHHSDIDSIFLYERPASQPVKIESAKLSASLEILENISGEFYKIIISLKF